MEKIEVIGVGVRIAGKECIVTEEQLNNMQALLKRAQPEQRNPLKDLNDPIWAREYDRAMQQGLHDRVTYSNATSAPPPAQSQQNTFGRASAALGTLMGWKP